MNLFLRHVIKSGDNCMLTTLHASDRKQKKKRRESVEIYSSTYHPQNDQSGKTTSAVHLSPPYLNNAGGAFSAV